MSVRFLKAAAAVHVLYTECVRLIPLKFPSYKTTSIGKQCLPLVFYPATCTVTRNGRYVVYNLLYSFFVYKPHMAVCVDSTSRVGCAIPEQNGGIQFLPNFVRW